MKTIYPKEILEEYYNRVSKPQDSDILGDWEVWVYGSDREAFPPHCHVRLKDDSLEFEVSLLNWEVINIKNSKLPNSWDSIDRRVKEAFFTWLNRPSKRQGGLINKIVLYNYWNDSNVQNPLEKWVDKKEGIDKDLIGFLHEEEVISMDDLVQSLFDAIQPIYLNDFQECERLHKIAQYDPIQFAKEIKLPFKFTEFNVNNKIIGIIQSHERMYYEIAKTKYDK